MLARLAFPKRGTKNRSEQTSVTSGKFSEGIESIVHQPLPSTRLDETLSSHPKALTVTFSFFSREAARECRRKKKEYVKCLENRVAVLENQNRTLIEELRLLKDIYKHKAE